MEIGRVIGRVVATKKHELIKGVKLLIVQREDSDGNHIGEPIIAVDTIGAGFHEMVLLAVGGEATLPFLPEKPPYDYAVTGIIDEAEVREKFITY